MSTDQISVIYPYGNLQIRPVRIIMGVGIFLDDFKDTELTDLYFPSFTYFYVLDMSNKRL